VAGGAKRSAPGDAAEMPALLSGLVKRWMRTLPALMLPGLAAAQTLPQPVLPESPAERRPLPVLPDAAPPRLELPPAPPPVPAPDTPQVRVPVDTIEVQGNTVFSTAELRQAVVSRYEGRALGVDDIEALRRELTEYYVTRRYLNSGAIIPDQDLADGRLTVRIIEGRLTEVRVTGLVRLAPEYVERRIALDAEGPLNAERLYRRLMLLQQDPRIAELHAELRPGLAPGEAVLAVQVAEAGAHRAAVSFANSRSPSIGANRTEVYLADENLTGRGDVLAARLGWTSGLDDGRLSYSLPLSPRETLLTVRAERSRSTVLEPPFRDLGIDGHLEAYTVGLIHPLVRRVDETLSVGLALDRRRSETFLLGVPFSFSPGVQDGVSTVTALRFSQEWLVRESRSVFAARSTLSRGLDALGATRNPSAPDSRFVTWLGQAQWVRRAGREVLVLVRSDVQLSTRALLPIEKFPVGGMASVRGYRENELVRDNGASVSVEARVPVARVTLPGGAADEGELALAPFADWGRGWNRGERQESLASVGIGVHWTPARRLHLQAYKGFPLKSRPRSGNTLQDRGIHFVLFLRLL
jgi:hemolysin activation/secretion protein